MRRAVEAEEPSEMRESTEHEARLNQQRHEPMPASQPDSPAGGGQGDAVQAMMGGPPPQGDVPDAPATQIAAADNEEGQVTRVTRVANAVPGQPDGEVDTRS